jgi:hypothetical protein
MSGTAKRVLAVVALVLAVAAAALVITVVRRNQPSEVAVKPGDPAVVSLGDDARVSLPRLGVDRAGTLSLRTADVSSAPSGAELGQPYEIRLAGAVLRQPVTVRLAVPDEAPADAALWLARQDTAGTWKAQPVSVDAGRSFATADVDGPAVVAVGWLDPDALRTEISAPYRWLLGATPTVAPSSAPGSTPSTPAGTDSGAPTVSPAPSESTTSEPTAAAPSSAGTAASVADSGATTTTVATGSTSAGPECPGADQAKTEGVELRVTGDAVRSCAGVVDGRLTVRLTGVAPYPVYVALSPDVTPRRRPGAAPAFFADRVASSLAAIGAGPGVVLRPGEELDLEVDRSLTSSTTIFVQARPEATSAAAADVVLDLYQATFQKLAALGLVRSPVEWNVAPCAETAPTADAAPLLACVGAAARTAVAGSAAGTGTVADAARAGFSVPAALADALAGRVVALTAPGLVAPPASAVTVIFRPAGQLAGQVPGATPRFLFLVNTSSTMSAQDSGGTPKLVGAQTALMTALDAMPPAASVALRTYPGPSGDCGGGEQQFGFTSPIDAGLRGKVLQGAAAGGAPTGPALLAAADDLRRARVTGARIVLISDGRATCGGDPCETARALADEDLAVVDTIAYGPSGPGEQELACVAAATGGRFQRVADSAALHDAVIGLTSGKLSISVDGPAVDAVVAPQARVTISAVVTNTSQLRVDDVRVLLRFPGAVGNLDPGAPAPARAIGNLAPGEKRSVRWDYSAGDASAGEVSWFTVTASGTNALPAQAVGAVRYAAEEASTAPGPILAGARTVALLGDAYAAGPSGAKRLTAPDATTVDLRGLTMGEDSQLAELSGISPAADAVVLSAGGADAGLRDAVVTCAVSDCLGATRPNSALSGACLDAYLRAKAFADKAPAAVAGCPPFRADFATEARARAAGIVGDLLASYRAVDHALNGGGRAAPILALAYPQLLPADEARGTCASALTPAELRFLDDLTDLVNRQIASAAATARADGLPVYYVPDTADALRPDHTLCTTSPHVTGGDAAPRAWAKDPRAMRPDGDGYDDLNAALLRWTNTDPARIPVIRRVAAGDGKVTVAQLQSGEVALVAAPDGVAATVEPGLGVRVRAEGFAPDSTVTFTIWSAPRAVGATTAGSSGTVAGTAVMPSDLPPGRHTLMATGVGADGAPRALYAVVTVARPYPRIAVGVGVGALALLVIGLIGMGVQRRRERARLTT